MIDKSKIKNNDFIDDADDSLTLDDCDMDSMTVCKGNSDFRSTIPTSMRISAADIELAKQISREKGLKYQTLLKMYIHEGLNRDKKILISWNLNSSNIRLIEDIFYKKISRLENNWYERN